MHMLVNLSELDGLKGGRGEASCVIKCKLCSRENSIDILGENSIDILGENHSWAQRKLSLLNPLNILLSINGLLLSY